MFGSVDGTWAPAAACPRKFEAGAGETLGFCRLPLATWAPAGACPRMFESGDGETCLGWCLEVRRRFISMNIEARLIYADRQNLLTFTFPCIRVILYFYTCVNRLPLSCIPSACLDQRRPCAICRKPTPTPCLNLPTPCSKLTP